MKKKENYEIFMSVKFKLRQQKQNDKRFIKVKLDERKGQL